MRVVVVTPPEPVVTASEAIAQLRLDITGEDELLDGLIAAATANIDGPDGWLGRAIGMQTLELHVPDFCGGLIVLPCMPIVSLTSVTYLDAAGVAQSVATGDAYLVDRILCTRAGWSAPATAYRADAVRIRYVAGYPDQDGKSTVPASIRHAILMMVARLYASRGEDHATSLMEDRTVERLLAPYRVF